MNVTATRLDIVATSTGFVVMCKIPMVVVVAVFLNAYALTLLSVAATHYHSF